MTTWDEIHVGDMVRGADQRVWTVVGRGPVRRWAAGGDEAVFTFRLDERSVSAFRTLGAPVELVERADHTGEASAVGALLDTGLDVKLMEEATVTVDQFTPPAARKREFDHLNRYLLPHPETGVEQAWTRVSTVARTVADEYGLNAWKQRMVAKGIALRPDLAAGAAAADPDEDKSTLDNIAKQAMDAAESRRGANLGTAQHSFTQRLDRGERLDQLCAPAPLASDLVAYLDVYKAARLRVEHVERIVCLPEMNVAGKFDRIVRQPPGDAKAAPLSVLDLKTGKDLSYSWLEIAIQQALYSHGAYMWDAARECWEPMPAVDQHRALVLHLPVGKARGQLYAVNLIEGWRLAQLAMEVRKARSGARSLAWLVEPDDPATVALHHVSRAASREELAALWERLYPRGLWTDVVNDAAMARQKELEGAA
jgi:hypothetical protein